MKSLMIALAAATLMLPMTVGCSRTVAHEDRVSHNPITGTDTHHETTVTQNPDGSYTTEHQTQKYH
ncbi:MAG: hypothetical protein ACTHN5_02805 [Phycisphaerae bacterium]